MDGSSCDGSGSIPSGSLLDYADTSDLSASSTLIVRNGDSSPNDTYFVEITLSTDRSTSPKTTLTATWRRNGQQYVSQCQYNNAFTGSSPLTLSVYVFIQNLCTFSDWNLKGYPESRIRVCFFDEYDRASTVNDDFYTFSKIDFSFCADSWNLDTTFSEQSVIVDEAQYWTSSHGNGAALQHVILNDSATATTIIHGLYNVSDGSMNVSRQWTGVAPFDELDITFSYWTVDIFGNETGNVSLFVNGMKIHTFDWLLNECPLQIAPNAITLNGSASSLQSQINTNTVICIEGIHTLRYCCTY